MSEGNEGKLGFLDAISIAVGGMIGGGVFSVLGIVATVAGAASWLAFMVVFGAMSYLAFHERDHEEITPIWPAIGVLGTALFFVLLVWHLWSAQRGTFYVVAAVTVAVLSIELLYFERDSIVDGIKQVESEIDHAD
jgi:hypothetical protein